MTYWAPYIGQGLLIGALLVSIISLFTFREGGEVKPSSNFQHFYSIQVILLLSAFLWLILAYLRSDFSFLIVVLHSHTQKPWLYKFAAAWGNHEGSMVLWTTLLSIVGWAAFYSQGLKNKNLLVVFSVLNALFILFMLMTCDPFSPILDIPSEGRDLNPLLQDPLLAIHPPFLYAGYLSTAVLFALAILKDDALETWRRWTLLSWTFLTIGLGLGSFWAYYELGWGGWWFWDPVENVALIPWLILTALLHNLISQKKDAPFSHLSRWLGYISFMACLGGTFIVRSGLLTSVHSFAIDPERGLFFALLCLGIFLPTVPLMINYHRDSTSSKEISQFLDRVFILRLGVGLFLLGAGVITFGTLYPLVLEGLGHPITIGPPYFKATFIPMMLPLLVLMVLQLWPTYKIPEVWSGLLLALFITLICLYWGWITNLIYLLIMVLGLWLFLGTLQHAFKNFSLNKLPMTIAHGGLALAVLGMVLSVALEQETLVALKEGEKTSFVGRTITFKELQPHKGSTYMAQRAVLGDDQGRFLTPEKRFYWAQGIIHNETAIHSFGLDHLYVVLGDRYDNDSWSFRFYHKPWINLIWLGGGFMAIGGILGFWRRRWYQSLVLFLFLIPLSSSHSINVHEQLADQALEMRAKTLGDQLLCPTCAGQILNDSETEEAQLLRAIIREQLRKGYSDQQVVNWFMDRYGDKILLSPPLNWTTGVLWGLPWLVFLGLFGLVMFRGFRKLLDKEI